MENEQEFEPMNPTIILGAQEARPGDGKGKLLMSVGVADTKCNIS